MSLTSGQSSESKAEVIKEGMLHKRSGGLGIFCPRYAIIKGPPDSTLQMWKPAQLKDGKPNGAPHKQYPLSGASIKSTDSPQARAAFVLRKKRETFNKGTREDAMLSAGSKEETIAWIDALKHAGADLIGDVPAGLQCLEDVMEEDKRVQKSLAIKPAELDFAPHWTAEQAKGYISQISMAKLKARKFAADAETAKLIARNTSVPESLTFKMPSREEQEAAELRLNAKLEAKGRLEQKTRVSDSSYMLPPSSPLQDYYDERLQLLKLKADAQAHDVIGYLEKPRLEHRLKAVEHMARAKQDLEAVATSIGSAVADGVARQSELNALAHVIEMTSRRVDHYNQIVRAGGKQSWLKRLSLQLPGSTPKSQEYVASLDEHQKLLDMREMVRSLQRAKEDMQSAAELGSPVDINKVEDHMVKPLEDAKDYAEEVCKDAPELKQLSRRLERVKAVLGVRMELRKCHSECNEEQLATRSAESLREEVAAQLRAAKERAEEMGAGGVPEVERACLLLKDVEKAAHLKELLGASAAKPTLPTTSIASLRTLMSEREALLARVSEEKQGEEYRRLREECQYNASLIEAKRVAAECSEDIELATPNISIALLQQMQQSAEAAMESKTWEGDATTSTLGPHAEQPTELCSLHAQLQTVASMITTKEELLRLADGDATDAAKTPEELERRIAELKEAESRTIQGLPKSGSRVDALDLGCDWVNFCASPGSSSEARSIFGGEEANALARRIGDLQQLIELKNQLTQMATEPISMAMPVQMLREFMGSQLHPLLDRSRRLGAQDAAEHKHAEARMTLISQIISAKEEMAAAAVAAAAQTRNARLERVRVVRDRLHTAQKAAIDLNAQMTCGPSTGGTSQEGSEWKALEAQIERIGELYDMKCEMSRVVKVPVDPMKPNDEMCTVARQQHEMICKAKAVDAAGGVELAECEARLTAVEHMVKVREDMRSAAALTKAPHTHATDWATTHSLPPPDTPDMSGDVGGDGTDAFQLEGEPLLLEQDQDTLVELLCYISSLLERSSDLGIADCDEHSALCKYRDRAEAILTAKKEAVAAVAAVEKLGTQPGNEALEVLLDEHHRLLAARDALANHLGDATEATPLNTKISELHALIDAKQACYTACDEQLTTASSSGAEEARARLEAAYSAAERKDAIDADLERNIVRRRKQFDTLDALHAEIARGVGQPCDPHMEPDALLMRAASALSPLKFRLSAVPVQETGSDNTSAPEALRLDKLIEKAVVYAECKLEAGALADYVKKNVTENRGLPVKLQKDDLEKIRQCKERVLSRVRDCGEDGEAASEAVTFELIEEMQRLSAQEEQITTSLQGGGKSARYADAPKPPKTWLQGENPYHIACLPVEGEERDAVVRTFMKTQSRPIQVVEVERVQNLALWEPYAVKRKGILSREIKDVFTTIVSSESDAETKLDKKWLFHGTNEATVPKIIHQGFDRMFCGKNATRWGKGVYFARDASYSSHPLYSPPNASGIQHMFACRVVVGVYCVGRENALKPDLREGKDELPFDSTVDNEVNPAIFVTYHDAQAYPEYLIKFRPRR